MVKIMTKAIHCGKCRNMNQALSFLPVNIAGRNNVAKLTVFKNILHWKLVGKKEG